TTCCGIGWGRRWLMEIAARKLWRPIPEPWSCSPGSSAHDTTSASAALTWALT
ncbi:hypothetical protein M9458_013799, partial [Cirrhinus mrigala]